MSAYAIVLIVLSVLLVCLIAATVALWFARKKRIDRIVDETAEEDDDRPDRKN